MLKRIERTCERLERALDDDDEEVAVLCASTLRTLLLLAERDVADAADPLVASTFTELRARARALLARAPAQLRGAGAVLRLLDKVRSG